MKTIKVFSFSLSISVILLVSCTQKEQSKPIVIASISIQQKAVPEFKYDSISKDTVIIVNFGNCGSNSFGTYFKMSPYGEGTKFQFLREQDNEHGYNDRSIRTPVLEFCLNKKFACKELYTGKSPEVDSISKRINKDDWGFSVDIEGHLVTFIITGIYHCTFDEVAKIKRTSSVQKISLQNNYSDVEGDRRVSGSAKIEISAPILN